MKIIAVTLALAAPAAAQDHARCHAAPSTDRRAAVDHRHDEASGVSHASSVHHFLLVPEGGTIVLEATDGGDDATRDRIREHLQDIARAFAAGDFSMPRRIHAERPPGVEVMIERRSEIRYAFEPTERGGRVTIATGDADALRAVHAFLRFQISDHGTGDPVE